MKPSSHCRAFSLVELSMVIAIIGLLIGGIILGRGMIRASELRGATTEINNYITAINNFKSQYKGLPGDLINAANYWSTTTNGNGDGQIYYTSVVVVMIPGPPPMTSTTTTGAEMYYAWQHLAMAGFISGTYTGTSTSLPTSKLSNGVYRVGYWIPGQTLSVISPSYRLNYNNAITLSAKNGGATNLLTPTDAFSVDTKMDDGLPASGNWMANTNSFNTASSCVQSANNTDFSSATNLYNTAYNDKACGFTVMTGN